MHTFEVDNTMHSRIPCGSSDLSQSFMNNHITWTELVSTLRNVKDTSPGPDDICYKMIVNLPDNGKELLLKLYNQIWTTGCIPTKWTHAIVIPVLKNKKPKMLPSSYRPISLTCTLCKVMEKIIAQRLSHYFESNNLLNINQSGFRKGRRTTDHILRLHDIVQKSVANERSVLAVFIF